MNDSHENGGRRGNVNVMDIAGSHELVSVEMDNPSQYPRGLPYRVRLGCVEPYVSSRIGTRDSSSKDRRQIPLRRPNETPKRTALRMHSISYGLREVTEAADPGRLYAELPSGAIGCTTRSYGGLPVFRRRSTLPAIPRPVANRSAPTLATSLIRGRNDR
jgi:hypothetical protein